VAGQRGRGASAGGRRGLLPGGQRQRVALARSLVTEPSLVLLDEPLANLDVHLRAAMEDEFARFHERTATTMIYITHDQAEAMALADRIAVMDRGRLLQIATPSDLFRQPANETVARFIGEGMVLPAEVGAADSEGRCQGRIYGLEVSLRASPLQKAGHAKVCLRARDLAIAGPGQTGLSAHIVRTVYQGGFFRLEASLVRAPDVTVHLAVPEPFHHGPGDVVDIVVNDGWVLPAPTES